jgi:hypothetical protein
MEAGGGGYGKEEDVGLRGCSGRNSAIVYMTVHLVSLHST